MFTVASEKVVKALIEYENEGVRKDQETYDRYLTELIKAIREDLRIKDKNFPTIGLRTARKPKVNPAKI